MQAKRSRWKRFGLIVLKIYAGMCTLVVTGVLVIVLWALAVEPAQESAMPRTEQNSTPLNSAWLESMSNIHLTLDPVHINAHDEPISLFGQTLTNGTAELRSSGSAVQKPQ